MGFHRIDGVHSQAQMFSFLSLIYSFHFLFTRNFCTFRGTNSSVNMMSELWVSILGSAFSPGDMLIIKVITLAIQATVTHEASSHSYLQSHVMDLDPDKVFFSFLGFGFL